MGFIEEQALPDGAASSALQLTVQELLGLVLSELKIMNLHLSEITEDKIEERDL